MVKLSFKNQSLSLSFVHPFYSLSSELMQSSRASSLSSTERARLSPLIATPLQLQLRRLCSSVWPVCMPWIHQSHIETPKPLVYIVGTHVDKLGSSAEEKINELDEHLDSLIQSNGFGHLVQYADSNRRQVMFAVDNTSDSDEQFELIHSNVNSLMGGREDFTIDFPMRYLLFCLELQNLKLNAIPIDKFRAMTALFKIMKCLVSCSFSTSELESSNILTKMVCDTLSSKSLKFSSAKSPTSFSILFLPRHSKHKKSKIIKKGFYSFGSERYHWQRR